MDVEMALVPKELLEEVLNTAESDSVSVEGEWAVGAQEHAEFEADRAKIDELRRIAGIVSASPASASPPHP